MRTSIHSVSAVLALSVLLGGSARADVLQVDGSGAPGHFATIQSAIDAAAPGDTVLVDATLDTSAESLVIDGKPLTVAMDAAFAVTTIRHLVVRNLPAGETLTLCGLRVTSPPDTGMEFLNNAGTLRLYDISAAGKQGIPLGASQISRPGSTGVRFTQCADVTLRDCGFGGGPGGDDPGSLELATSDGGTGGVVTGSKLSCFFSSFTGGRGGNVSEALGLNAGGTGGTGLVNAGSSLFFYGGDSSGGVGGTAQLGKGGDGGTGFVQGGAAAHWDTYNSAPHGGAGGPSSFGEDGSAGAAQQLFGGSTQELGVVPAFARDCWTNTPVREGETVELTCSGFQDDIWLLLGVGTLNQLLPAYQGALMVGPDLFSGGLVYVGYVPFLAITFPLGPVPPLPAGMDAIELQLQTVMKVGGPGFNLGAPEHLILLDSAY